MRRFILRKPEYYCPHWLLVRHKKREPLLIFLSHRGSLRNINDGNKTSKEVRLLSKRIKTLHVYRTFGYSSLSSSSFAQLQCLISVIPNSKFYRENVEVLRRISASCFQTFLHLPQNSGLHSIN